MLVCLCHPISDRALKAVIDEGARTVRDVAMTCRAGAGCGACKRAIAQMIQERSSALPASSSAGACAPCEHPLRPSHEGPTEGH